MCKKLSKAFLSHLLLLNEVAPHGPYTYIWKAWAQMPLWRYFLLPSLGMKLYWVSKSLLGQPINHLFISGGKINLETTIHISSPKRSPVLAGGILDCFLLLGVEIWWYMPKYKKHNKEPIPSSFTTNLPVGPRAHRLFPISFWSFALHIKRSKTRSEKDVPY